MLLCIKLQQCGCQNRAKNDEVQIRQISRQRDKKYILTQIMAPCGLNTASSAGVQGKVTLNTKKVFWLLKNPAKDKRSSTDTIPAAPAIPPADSSAVHIQLSKPGWFVIINNPVLLSEGLVSRNCSLRWQMNARPFSMPQSCSAHFAHPGTCHRTIAYSSQFPFPARKFSAFILQ